MSRPIYGYVYELILAGQSATDHSYVGMTTTTIHRRVHGPAGHTSARDVARDPWKADILPGRAGYRCLEILRSTGDCAENDRALRRAEAFWIDRLRPTYNDVRPVRPPVTDPQPARRTPRGRYQPIGPARRKRRIKILPLIMLALFTIPPVVMVAWIVSAMELPWPQAPWIAAPLVGSFIGWETFWAARRSWRRLTR